MPERHVNLGEARHESANIDYTIEDDVVLSELGRSKIGELPIAGKVMAIEKQLNQRNTTTIITKTGEEVTYQSNFFRKAKKVNLSPKKES